MRAARRPSAPPRGPGGRPAGRWLLLAATGWLALLATLLPSGSALRPTVVGLFLVTCPGAALLRRWRHSERLERLVLAVAVSVSVSVLVTEAQIFAGLWQPRGSVAIVAAITTVAAVAPWPFDRRAESEEERRWPPG